jgi:hypothetical protein
MKILLRITLVALTMAAAVSFWANHAGAQANWGTWYDGGRGIDWRAFKQNGAVCQIQFRDHANPQKWEDVSAHVVYTDSTGKRAVQDGEANTMAGHYVYLSGCSDVQSVVVTGVR